MKTIIEMAIEAGVPCNSNWAEQYLEHFAELVRAEAQAEEREACAKVFDEMADQMVADMEPSTAIAWVRNRAEFIRARGNT